MSNQLQINMGLRSTREIIPVNPQLVANCKHYVDAVFLCMSLSTNGWSQAEWAKQLGYKSAGSFSEILNRFKGDTENKRPKFFDNEKQGLIQRLAGNSAIQQWTEMELFGQLNCQRSPSMEKEMLERRIREIEQLEATA